jgi:selenide,water dikinase
MQMPEVEPRLTEMAHGGGCGCKLAPGLLQEILGQLPMPSWPGLMVGAETSDDAAVYRMNDAQALVATTDFFMPVVDDPYEFGRIAATNALSDVYALGATPILALAILGVPVGKLALHSVQRILAGGVAVCTAAGIAVAGGHSIDNPEPIYGLVALGVVHPDRVLRNSTARPGDRLILTKGLGVGIYSAAFKKAALPAPLYAELLATTTQLNSIGADLAQFPGVHALTDVTGFGLLGHTLEVCRGSGTGAVLHLASLPFLPGVRQLAAQGFATGAATRNWSSYGTQVQLPESVTEWERGLLCDPQTSGGLLISVEQGRVAELLRRLTSAGFAHAVEIGEIVAARPGVRVI